MSFHVFFRVVSRRPDLMKRLRILEPILFPQIRIVFKHEGSNVLTIGCDVVVPENREPQPLGGQPRRC